VLAREILSRLRDDLGGLMQLLYRVDVPEQAVANAFQAPTLHEVAGALAELVLARALRTVALRRQLASDGGKAADGSPQAAADNVEDD
jgi:hypothetical protein